MRKANLMTSVETPQADLPDRYLQTEPGLHTFL